MPWGALAQAAMTALVTLLVGGLYRKATAYFAGSVEWRRELKGDMDALKEATQATMRAQLLHNAEKYLDRGWLTPEERASWHDMHSKYSALGFNGLIDSYSAKLDKLPDRVI